MALAWLRPTANGRASAAGGRASAFWVALAFVGVLLAGSGAAPVSADDPVVRAVLFYSPTCPHCHQVMTEDLPPIQASFGDRLVVLAVDVTLPVGETLYRAAVTRFGIPDERLGVPTLIVSDVVLVGSVEIPQQLPSIAERLLAGGGSDWPEIPGLAAVLPSSQPSATPVPAAASPGATSAGPVGSAAPADAAGSTPAPGSPVADAIERAGRDPLGSTLAIVVLIGLAVSLAWVAVAAVRAGGRTGSGRLPASIAATALAGLVIAAYLASVELAGSSAVCGPVGDCNLVHASVYARLFEIPVGVLGSAGYAAILGCWLVARGARGALVEISQWALVGLAVIGTLFSAYLTFLEPFVIGATCAWCLASAVLMDATLLMTSAAMWPWRPWTKPARV